MTMVQYKLLHLIGIMALFFGLGGALMSHAVTSAVKAKVRILASVLHAGSLVLLLITGFAMSGHMHKDGTPHWIWGKLFIWLLFGAIYSLCKRKAQLALLLTVIIGVLGLSAAYMAMMKPF